MYFPPFQLFCFQLRVGCDEFFFRDAIFAADAVDGFPAFHFVDVAIALLGDDGRLVCRLVALNDGEVGCLVCGRDDDDLSAAEVAFAQSRIGLANGFHSDIISFHKPVECFPGWMVWYCGPLLSFDCGIRRVSPALISRSLPGFRRTMSATETLYVAAMEVRFSPRAMVWRK